MRDRSRRNALRLAAGMIAVVSWLVLMTGTRHDDPVGLLAPFLVLAALACVAGWRRDPVAAMVTYLGGIVGATAVTWAAGTVGVEPGADPAMRSSYHLMLIVIAAAISAVVGLLAVGGGYLVGHLAQRLSRR